MAEAAAAAAAVEASEERRRVGAREDAARAEGERMMLLEEAVRGLAGTVVHHPEVTMYYLIGVSTIW